jgi:hypothetical protein
MNHRVGKTLFAQGEEKTIVNGLLFFDSAAENVEL